MFIFKLHFYATISLGAHITASSVLEFQGKAIKHQFAKIQVWVWVCPAIRGRTIVNPQLDFGELTTIRFSLKFYDDGCRYFDPQDNGYWDCEDYVNSTCGTLWPRLIAYLLPRPTMWHWHGYLVNEPNAVRRLHVRRCFFKLLRLIHNNAKSGLNPHSATENTVTSR